MNVICRILGHHRSRRFAALNAADERWESYCTRCNVRLTREHGGEWQQSSPTEAPALRALHAPNAHVERETAEVA